jgi:hypothetical protein
VAAPLFGMQVTRVAVRHAAEIRQAITEFAQQPNGALVVAPNSVTIRYRKAIIDLAAQTRLPAVYPYRLLPKAARLFRMELTCLIIGGKGQLMSIAS